MHLYALFPLTSHAAAVPGHGVKVGEVVYCFGGFRPATFVRKAGSSRCQEATRCAHNRIAGKSVDDLYIHAVDKWSFRKLSSYCF